VLQRWGDSRHYVVMSREARFRALFSDHYPVVARYVLARGYQPADADDLISATFEVAWRRLDTVPGGREAVPWLLTVARNLSRNAHRKARRDLAVVDRLAAVEPAWDATDVGDRAGWAELRRALGRLKAVDRDLILLVAWDELTPSEAGRVLGLRPVAARSRLHRARQRLAELLEVDHIENPSPDSNGRSASTPTT
jgi:RNA polymerase sigma factor (sigma-70 family)